MKTLFDLLIENDHYYEHVGTHDSVILAIWK